MGYNYYNFDASTSDTQASEGSFKTHCLPVCPNLIGGILLYGKDENGNLLDDTDLKNYYAPMNGNPLIGYASNDINRGTDLLRGSMNQTESKKLENGYQFVFDFSTSQANGTIHSLGLTSKWGGRVGYGSTYDDYSQYIVKTGRLSSQVNTDADWDNLCRQANIVSFDPISETGIFVRVISEKTIEVGTINMPLHTIGLNDSFNGKGKNFTLIEPNESNKSFKFNNFAALTKGVFYGTFIDGGEFIWGFQHKNNIEGNKEENATILWVKINKETFQIEEGTWTLANTQLYKFGQYTTSSISGYNYAIIKDNILYAIQYTNTSYMSGVYTIPLSDENPTGIKLLTFVDGEAREFFPGTNYDHDYYSYTAVNEINNVITYREGYIHNGQLYPKKSPSTYLSYDYNYMGLSACPKPGLKYGPFLLSMGAYTYSYSSTKIYYWLFETYLMTTYLATVNNLTNPIEKNNDKTMKITYTLIETE